MTTTKFKYRVLEGASQFDMKQFSKPPGLMNRGNGLGFASSHLLILFSTVHHVQNNTSQNGEL